MNTENENTKVEENQTSKVSSEGEAQSEAKEPTPEEIARYQAQRIKYFKSQMPYLKAEADYTRLIAEIEENHVRKVEARMRYARYMMSQNQFEQKEGGASNTESNEGSVNKAETKLSVVNEEGQEENPTKSE